MKCTSMKLQSRISVNSRKLCKDSDIHENDKDVFVTKEFNGYNVVNQKIPSSSKELPKVSVNILNLPDGFRCYEAGYSLAKWSKKRPRLTSSKTSRRPSSQLLDQDYDDSYDFSEIIQSVDDDINEEALNEEQYEIDSDIEELIRSSQKNERAPEIQKKKRKVSKEDTSEKVSKKKLKRKLRKTIRFSFSKPASPETEQVIRVDVTSNISVETFQQMEVNTGDCSRGHMKIANENKSDGYFVEERDVEDNLILRCSQLAISSKIKKR